MPSSITYLDCGNNFYLTSLPSSLPNSLIQFYCYNNPKLKNLPSLPNSLTYFRCDGDSLTTIPTLPSTLQTFYCFNNYIYCFPVFPHSIINLDIDPNPYNCLPNYITAMGSDTVTYPKCAVSNSNGCALAYIKEYARENKQLYIFPNPTTGDLYINLSAQNAGNMLVHISDVNGRQLLNNTYTANTGANSYQLDLSSLDNGVYSIAITDDGGNILKQDKVILTK